MTDSPLKISDRLELPLEAVTQTFAILAKRGVGKTYLSAVMAEEMLKAREKADFGICIIDPIGVWYGLRTSANGKDAGFKVVVFGGEHGDLPLDENMGESIANFVVDDRVPAILDLSLLRKGAQTRFMSSFLETVYRRNRLPLHLIVDEADAFAPQNPKSGAKAEDEKGWSEARMLGAMEDLVRRGRARGVGMTLVTQRAAVLNKNVLTQVEVLVCLRTIAPQDRKAIDSWIEVHGTPEQRKELLDSLPSLPVGTAWFWSPAWLDVFRKVKVRRRETLDTSATPKVGEARATTRLVADVDLDELKKRFSAAVEKKQASDPVALRRRVAELERELAARDRMPGLDADALRGEGARLRGETATADLLYLQGKLEEAESAIDAATAKFAELVQGTVDDCARRAGLYDGRGHYSPAPGHGPRARELPVSRPPAEAPKREAPAGARFSSSNEAPKQAPSASSNGRGDRSLKDAEVKVLNALAWYPGGRTTKQITQMTGARGGTLHAALAEFRRRGYITGKADALKITPFGDAALGARREDKPTGSNALAGWKARLKPAEARIIDELVVRPLSADFLTEACGLRGGTLYAALARLRSFGLVTGTNRELRLADELRD